MNYILHNVVFMLILVRANFVVQSLSFAAVNNPDHSTPWAIIMW